MVYYWPGLGATWY